MSRPPFAVSHVIFDIDGTLVDYVPAIRAGLDAVAAAVSARTGRSDVRPGQLWAIRNEVAVDPAWRDRSLDAIRRESFRRVLVAYDADEDARDELHDRYYGARNAAITVFPEVEPVLAALRQRGLTLVAASNGDVRLDSHGLGGYFAETHYADDVGLRKPDPGFFALVVERAGATAAASLAVGDRLDNDYEPARAAGLQAVLVDRADRTRDDAVIRVRALTELAALLAPA